ncbi:MAG: DNA methyltransferase [bacterium]
MAQQQKLHNYWFALGREKLLSAAEISAFFKLSKATVLEIKEKNIFFSRIENDLLFKQGILKLETAKKIDAHEWMSKLGGTIKIAEQINQEMKRDEIENVIAQELMEVKGKIVFGISCYGSVARNARDAGRLALNVKKILKQKGRSVRVVPNKESALSSSVVANNHLTEKGGEFLIALIGSNRYSLAKTICVQPFVQFSKRDYGRPMRDDFSGMIPPKLAMMMINLAGIKDGTILDPFCGSGTIISEAILLGYSDLLASDLSLKAVDDCKENINWIVNNYPVNSAKYSVKQVDVKKASVEYGANSVDAIITEPYLGRPLKGNESKERLEAQTRELGTLYLSAFREFKKILCKNGVVVIIIPRFKFSNDWVRISIGEKIKELGFKAEPLLDNHEFLLYHRPNQRVAREIWKFVKCLHENSTHPRLG